MNEHRVTATQAEVADVGRDANLRRLFAPRSIAVVGASADPAKAGSQVVRSLSRFPGQLFCVHPREREIQGFPCFPRLASLPQPVDLAVLAIPARDCVKVAAEAGAAGVGGLCIVSGGFGESGESGAALQRELAAICGDTGLRLLGPNTSGFIDPHAECVASFVPDAARLSRGRVAVVAQSGGVNLSVAFLLDQLREGVSFAAGLGNAIDVDSADILALLADDANTTAIALHLEGVPRGRKLFDVLRTVTPRKPVVALAAGRSDTGEFAMSHTGNLLGSHARTVAALRQAGAVVVDSTEELAQAAALLAHGRLAPKQTNGFGLITGQAGPGLLIADALRSRDVTVPELGSQTISQIEALLPPLTFVRNPVDTGRPGPAFARVAHCVAADPRIDALLVYALNEPAILDPAQALVPVHEHSGKPVVFGTLGLDADLAPVLAHLRTANLPVVLGPERLALAARVLNEDSRAQWRLSRANVTAPRTSDAHPLRGSFNEHRAKQLLQEYGVRCPKGRLCASREEALAAFKELARPLVVKVASADIAHKTEVGGVFLDVQDETQLAVALDSIAEIPTSDVTQYLIEEMARPGVELIVGGVRDRSWGPCVMVGLGGVMAEAMADSSVRLACVDELDVGEMLEELRGKAVLDGFRGLPRCDRDAIARAIQAVSCALLDHPEIAEIEINPLRVDAEGAVALDALVVLTSPAGCA